LYHHTPAITNLVIETEYAKVWRKTRYVFIALMLVVVAYGVMSFAWSIIAERKAETMANLLATLRPGYTTMDSAKELFQANGVSVDILHNACGTTNKGDSCDDLSLSAANFRRVGVIPLHIGSGLDVVVMLAPFPPVKRAAFAANLYFINGILASINTGYGVGTTSVGYSRSVYLLQAQILMCPFLVLPSNICIR
jgi:hypothetical protein